MTRSVLIRLVLLAVALCGSLPACALFHRETGTRPEQRLILQGPPLPYRVTFSVVSENNRVLQSDAGKDESVEAGRSEPDASATSAPPGSVSPASGITSPASELSSSQAAALKSEMRDNSQLVLLRDEPPDSRVGLERRILSDVETAVKLLHSQGYYDGKARYTADWQARPVPVELILEPGPRYVIGTTTVMYRSGVSGQPHTPFPPEGAPDTLADMGVAGGIPAVADTVVAAVDKLPEWLRKRGYPFARVETTHYVADHARRALDAVVTVLTGPYATMDGVVFKGADNVGREYLEKLVPWTPGQPWDADQIEAFRDELQQSGLFRLITVKPAPLDSSPTKPAQTNPARQEKAPETQINELPVDVTLAEAAPRTLSGGFKYASDVGFGVQGSWEHRNFLGNGEKLRLALPIAQDRQELSASFNKPAFGRRDQSLLVDAAFRNEETDAYDQTALYGAVGLERRLSPHWWASVRVSGEGGTLDQGEGRKKYFLLGVPLSVRRDTTDNLLNPTRGTRLQATGTPYTGSWNKAFSTLRLRVDGSGYYAPFEGDGLVLAARVAAGSMTGTSLDDIPGSIRFYAGGGGSVRGYKYQSLGGHNSEGDPTGGLSFNELSLEARFKITETIGVVPFVDGGMVYDSSTPRWGKDMAWAVGLGLRYFTSIGPVRVDFAVPLEDRDRQKAFQFYVSIGQAF